MMDLCHLKNSELEAKFQKYKDRIVLQAADAVSGKHKWPKSWSSMEDPVVPLERNLYGHPLAGLLWERQFEKFLLKHGWEKIPNWECLFVHREKGLILSVYVDDIKLAGKKQNIDPMWKVLNKDVDLGEPTSFFDHVYLGCTHTTMRNKQRYCGQLQNHVRIANFYGGLEKLPFPQNLRISSWSYDMAGHAKKCVERYCELANMTTQQLYKVSTPCIDDHHFKEEETKSVGELSNVCSQIVLKCLYLARIGRPDISWSVNKLARSITKWTKACDKRLNRSISDIHYTCEYKQNCYVGNTAKQCRLGLFQDSDFAGDPEDSKSTSGGTLCVFGSHTFVPISWMCKKQTAVSHSSTESEIISLDTGLRLDSLPALELWDLIVSVFGNISHFSDRTGQPVNGKNKSHNKIYVVHDIDLVPSNVHVDMKNIYFKNISTKNIDTCERICFWKCFVCVFRLVRTWKMVWRTQLEKSNVRGNLGGAAILTCKIVRDAQVWVERQTEPSHSWFFPQFSFRRAVVKLLEVE